MKQMQSPVRCPACLMWVHLADGVVENHDRPSADTRGYQKTVIKYVPCPGSGRKNDVSPVS